VRQSANTNKVPARPPCCKHFIVVQAECKEHLQYVERTLHLFSRECQDLTHVIIHNKTGHTINIVARLIPRPNGSAPLSETHTQDVTDKERIRVAPSVKSWWAWGFRVEITVQGRNHCPRRIERRTLDIEGNRVVELTIACSGGS
jgi:hypothetical protein